MPPLPPVTKVLRIDLLQSYGGDTGIRNRLFFAYAGAGPTLADLNTLATTTGNAWGTNLSPLLVSGHALIQVNITDLNSTTGNQATLAVSKPGTVTTGSLLPNAVSAIIKFKIQRRYRGGHPRFYLTGQTSNNIATGQTWTTAYISQLTTSFAAMITAITTTPPTSIGTMTHTNVSYFSGFVNKTFPSLRTHPVPVLRGTPLQDTVLSYSVNPRYGSQRRRNQQTP